MFRVDLHVRLPATLHERLKESAKENHRSLNEEIAYRLKQTYEGWRLDRARP